ncbi:hypothetical protein HK096_007175, partial [Nowakowskiella sp. JEL0078]
PSGSHDVVEENIEEETNTISTSDVFFKSCQLQDISSPIKVVFLSTSTLEAVLANLQTLLNSVNLVNYVSVNRLEKGEKSEKISGTLLIHVKFPHSVNSC